MKAMLTTLRMAVILRVKVPRIKMFAIGTWKISNQMSS